MSRLLIIIGILVGMPAWTAAQDTVANARSAAPASISADATIMDWDLNVVQEGSNEWTCLPDRPTTPGNDPWCVTDAWLNSPPGRSQEVDRSLRPRIRAGPSVRARGAADARHSRATDARSRGRRRRTQP